MVGQFLLLTSFFVEKFVSLGFGSNLLAICEGAIGRKQVDADFVFFFIFWQQFLVYSLELSAGEGQFIFFSSLENKNILYKFIMSEWNWKNIRFRFICGTAGRMIIAGMYTPHMATLGNAWIKGPATMIRVCFLECSLSNHRLLSLESENCAQNRIYISFSWRRLGVKLGSWPTRKYFILRRFSLFSISLGSLRFRFKMRRYFAQSKYNFPILNSIIFYGHPCVWYVSLLIRHSFRFSLEYSLGSMRFTLKKIKNKSLIKNIINLNSLVHPCV